MKIQIGDWIRFRRGGALVIGQVEYITPRSSWDSTLSYHTELGEVEADGILERRQVAAWASPPTPDAEK